MQPMLAKYTASITELKKSPIQLLKYEKIIVEERLNDGEEPIQVDLDNL